MRGVHYWRFDCISEKFYFKPTMIFIYGFTTWIQNFLNYCSPPYNSLTLSKTLQVTSILFSLHKLCPVLSQTANLIIEGKKNQPPLFHFPRESETT